MANISIAVYDPAESISGSFWRWVAPGLDRRLLDRLYYDNASLNLPEDPSELDDHAIAGGFARLSPDWLFAYRFGDGGRDSRGRPGRFVLMVAAVSSSEASRCNLLPLLSCDAVTSVLKTAHKCCPLPEPEKLHVNVSLQEATVEPTHIAKAMREGKIEFIGAGSINLAAALFPCLPEEKNWQCTISRTLQQEQAYIHCQYPKKQPLGKMYVSKKVPTRITGNVISMPPTARHGGTLENKLSQENKSLSEPQTVQERLQQFSRKCKVLPVVLQKGWLYLITAFLLGGIAGFFIGRISTHDGIFSTASEAIFEYFFPWP